MKYPYISQQDLELYSGCGLVNLAVSLAVKGKESSFKSDVAKLSTGFLDFLGKERSYAKDLLKCAIHFKCKVKARIVLNPLKVEPSVCDSASDISLIIPLKVRGQRWYKHWVSVHKMSGEMYLYDPFEHSAKKFEKLDSLRSVLAFECYQLPEVKDSFYKNALLVEHSL